jgi:hypothetical protein
MSKLPRVLAAQHQIVQPFWLARLGVCLLESALDNAPPDASGVQRFYQLEAAASKTKEQRFKFKWEK